MHEAYPVACREKQEKRNQRPDQRGGGPHEDDPQEKYQEIAAAQQKVQSRQTVTVWILRIVRKSDDIEDRQHCRNHVNVCEDRQKPGEKMFHDSSP